MTSLLLFCFYNLSKRGLSFINGFLDGVPYRLHPILFCFCDWDKLVYLITFWKVPWLRFKSSLFCGCLTNLSQIRTIVTKCSTSKKRVLSENWVVLTQHTTITNYVKWIYFFIRQYLPYLGNLLFPWNNNTNRNNM